MLTDVQCRQAVCPPEKTRIRLFDSEGLYLEVPQSGSKRWFWKYRAAGKERRLALGSYPAVSLTSARQARARAKLQKADGVDPVHARKAARAALQDPKNDDFEAVALEWFARQEPQWSEALPNHVNTSRNGAGGGGCSSGQAFVKRKVVALTLPMGSVIPEPPDLDAARALLEQSEQKPMEDLLKEPSPR